MLYKLLQQVALGVACLMMGLAPARAETIKMGGTGAVTSLLEILGQAFERLSPGDKVVVVPRLGSTGGTKAVEAGAVDLGVTGRDLTPQEVAAGLKVQPFLETPFVFATDTRDPLNFSMAEILRVYSGETLTYADGVPIRLILRPRNDAQTLMLLQTFKGMDAAMDKARLRQELPTAATDQDNMDVAAKMPGAFAGFPLTQFLAEPNKLKVASIDGVAPTTESLAAGKYPLRLQVTWVFKGAHKPTTERFLAFIRGPEVAAIIARHGGTLVKAD